MKFLISKKKDKWKWNFNRIGNKWPCKCDHDVKFSVYCVIKWNVNIMNQESENKTLEIVSNRIWNKKKKLFSKFWV